MRIPRMLAIVLAGGAGSRLDALTDHRTKPAVRVAGNYRLIDVALSNLANSHVRDVWVVEQFLPHALNEHLSNGRPWDLDRTHAGLRILAPFTGGTGEGLPEGNSDSLWHFRRQIASFEPELVLVMSADHLFTLNLTDVVDTHRDAGADLTIVTTRHDGDASRYGVVKVGTKGVIEEFWYKPEEPPTDLVVTETFCFDGPALLTALEELGGEDGLDDYGEDLIPHFVENHTVVEHRLEGYWQDIGTLSAYWRAHMELLDGTGVDLDDPEWPIFTAPPQLVPARVGSSAEVAESMLASGSVVKGVVRHSVIGPSVQVEEGAHLEDCVVLDGARIGAGVHLSGCIVDEGAQLEGPMEVRTKDCVTLINGAGEVVRTEQVG